MRIGQGSRAGLLGIGKGNTMLNQESLNVVALANEDTVEDLLRSLGHDVKRLDRQGRRRRPEFLVLFEGRPSFVCEVKTIFSGGYLRDRNAHLSTHDPSLLNSGPATHEVDFSRIESNLTDAVGKYKVLEADDPMLRGIPYLVVLFFDFFADRFHLYPARMESFPAVSGIAKVVENHALDRAARALSLEELERRTREGDFAGLPAESVDFLLVENDCSSVALPTTFIEKCILSHRRAT
jgi:hypothetical protein